MNNKILERFKEYINVTQFNSIKISIASPEKMRSLSYGEVKKIETINYRTLKPERDGLFCAKIFGPQKDWECNCGKYKRMKHRGVTCEKCGVEVIQSRVRRERMGHIELVSSVAHIWFLKGIPSYLSLILGITVKDLERVIYFDSYIVVHPGSSSYARKNLLTPSEYEEYVTAHPEDTMFKAEMGAEAVKSILAMIDLNFEVRKLEEEYAQANSAALKHKLARRLKVAIGMLKANLRPEWIVLDVLPVLPPDLRPLVPLEGGRFASSDLNDLYRRVLNRNIRLRRLIELEAPGVIIKNEKRMLQESVDALIDNGRRGQPVRGSNRRPLKSLSEMLRGKQGRFRQNLLGKRVDYSGRSVIVVDPKLEMHQCGLPKIMALELFRPYVYVELQKRELASNLRVAKRMVEELAPGVWDALEEVVKGRPVLLNRAPTLHRLGIQAFYPILVEGKAIRIHPLVCSAFNADFDGDQMAVHVLLSSKARKEAVSLMLSTSNILSPAHGRPVSIPSQDMVLGLYYMTKGRRNMQSEGTIFADIKEVITAYQHGQINIQTFIKLQLSSGQIIETTVGRAFLYNVLPEKIEFSWVDKPMKKKDIGKLVSRVVKVAGLAVAASTLDKIKKLGFDFATSAGISLSIDDLYVPSEKEEVVNQSKKEIEKVEKLYRDGAISNGERYVKVIQIWARATEDVTNKMISGLENQDHLACDNVDKKDSSFNPVFIMLDSGARGTRTQIRQLGGMRGLLARPNGEIMETPIIANFKEGLNVFEYFISTHGARKGLSDTALKTADSGYLTRRLVDVSQDVIITEIDCQTLGHVKVIDLKVAGDVLEHVGARVFGRVLAGDLNDEITGKLILPLGTLVDEEAIEKIKDATISEIPVRSVLACQLKRGVCAKCYGMDLSTGNLVDVGLAVGIIAAQSIGEPGTQLTMQTFHVGGVAGGVVERNVVKTHFSGKIQFKGVHSVDNRSGQSVVMNRRAKIVIVTDGGRELEVIKLEQGSVLSVKEGGVVKVGDKLAEWDANRKAIMTDKAGTVSFVDLIENVTYHEQFEGATGQKRKIILERREEKRQPCIAVINKNEEEEGRYFLPTGAHLYVEDGDEVLPGDILSKLPLKESKSKDIVGGLPRIAELFEARIPKDAAVVSEVDGYVKFGGIHRGQRRITITTEEGEEHEYNIPRNKHLIVEDSEFVYSGDNLTDGVSNVHDILRILGPDELQKYFIQEIQEIYSLQGININDKHIELIVRQMLGKMCIVDPGDTNFIVGDRISKIHLQNVNMQLAADGKKVATAKPILMGITKASLGTESFLSAASFQETTRVLTEAAIRGQVDNLYGLKEAITVGKLIPAGTGVPSFELKYLGEDISELERQAREEEQLEKGLDKISLASM
ncbi:DNA-directed RNA polymerase subunit beta' [Candidatus Babeliales bacterium]|nr:DNA-directed RNA polymerase subunit beta' [Candidatus Babeliales bacterium]